MKGVLLIFAFQILFLPTVLSQQSNINRYSKLLDIGMTAGNSQGVFSLAYNFTKSVGENKKWEIGVGIRFSSYAGSKKDFITAGPARYTRSFTFPFLIVFAGQNEKNFDTLTVQRPFTNSLNLQFLLGYHVAPKWYAGFNIDLIGASFGRKGSAVFTSNGQTVIDPEVKPVPFNLLLTGDHDKGSLNSEFFMAYSLNKRIKLKAIYQFIFIEYQSQSVSQFFDNGVRNTRFRNKANNLGAGLSYQLN